MNQPYKVVHETWEHNGISYEMWRKESVKVPDDQKKRMSENAHNYYLATQGHKNATRKE